MAPAVVSGDFMARTLADMLEELEELQRRRSSGVIATQLGDQRAQFDDAEGIDTRIAGLQREISALSNRKYRRGLSRFRSN